MLYDNYRNKMLRRAAKLRQVIHLSPVITAALIVLIAVFTVFALAAGTVTDVSFPNSAAYGSAPVHSASAFLSDASFEYRLKGESEWSSEAPKMPGDYDVRVVTKSFFGERYKELDTFHVYPRRISVTSAATSIAYGETPLATAALNYGDRVVCESFVFESNVLANTKIKANAAAVKIYNAAGEDVTHAYEIETPYSDITVTKRELLLYVSDATHQYDGKEFSYKVYEIGEGSLVTGERLQAKFEKIITDAGTVKNVPVVQIVNKDGEDVTHFYNLNEQNIGNLIVTKRPLHIVTGTAAYTFDGNEKECRDYSFANGTSILPEHEIVVNAVKTQTFVDSVKNTMSFSVRDKVTGKDVTDNYAITVTEGTLTVERRTVTVTTGSQKWEYDGEKHSNRDITVDNLVFGTIPNDRYDIKDITDAGTLENSFTIRIMNGTSNITNNYNIVYNYGELEVTRRPITLETPSYEWVYDGNEHNVSEKVGSDVDVPCNILAGSVLDGCHIRYDFEHYATSNTVQPTVVNVWAPADNTVPVRILRDKYDVTTNATISEDITKNFAITYEYGKLEIEPRPITVKPKDVSKMYDGTPLVATEIEIIGETKLAKDTHILEYNMSGSRTYVDDEDVSTIAEIKVISGDEDLTRNYSITTEEGALEITPRPITITTPSATWVYDGKLHSVANDDLASKFAVSDSSQYSLPANHRIEYFAEADENREISSITNVNQSPVENKSTVLIKMGEKNVTENFKIDYEYGTFEVTKRPITVKTPNHDWKYDGNEHTVSEELECNCTIIAGTMPYEDYQFKYDINAENLPKITNAGKVDNTGTILIMHAGEDVTDNFQIDYEYGTLSVIPLQITVKTPDHSWVYDGNEHTVREFFDVDIKCIVKGEMPYADYQFRYDPDMQNLATLLNVAPAVSNESIVRIMHAGEDVTANFAITYEHGELKIIPRPITVKPKDVFKMYDGTPLVATEIEYFAGSLELVKPTHEFSEYSINGSCTNVWDTEKSRISAIKVWDKENNEDITYNYDIDYSNNTGNIIITPRPITVKTPDHDWKYDGNEHTVSEELECDCTIIAGEMPYEDYQFKYDINAENLPKITNAGKVDNTGTILIMHAGEDVTDNFQIDYEYGTFEVTKRPITVKTPNHSWVYDGNEHTIREFFETNINCTVNGKMPYADYQFRYDPDMQNLATLLNVAPAVSNESIVRIMHAGEDVTANFAITYEHGELKINPFEVTIKTPDHDWKYDGNEHTVREFFDVDIECTVKDEMPYADYQFRYDPNMQNIATLLNVAPAVRNESTIRIMHAGEDVTENFDIMYEYGELKINPRPVNITIHDAEYIFDGEAKKSERHDVDNSTPLVNGHKIDVTGVTYVTFVTRDPVSKKPLPVPNELVFEIKDANGIPVTSNYAINAPAGKITITPKPIRVTGTPAVPWTYDGKEHSHTGYTISPENGIVLGKDEIDNESITYITNVWESGKENAFKIKVIYEGDDITDSYDITYEYGKLKINPFEVTIKTPNHSWVYDGNEHTVSAELECNCTIIAGTMPYEDYQFKYDINAENLPKITNVGEVENTGTILIMHAGEDVTKNFDIKCESGKLLVYQRPVKITSGYGKKEYDGTPLTNNEFYTTKTSPYELVKGHSIVYDCDTYVSRTEEGQSENTYDKDSLRIYNGTEDVTSNYLIDYRQGMLIVEPSKENEEKTVFIKFKPSKSGNVYLKMTSKGHYNHTTKAWEVAPVYGLIDNKYNASYLTSIALKNALEKEGHTPIINTLEISEAKFYMLPYYTAMGDGYNVPANDVDVSGTPNPVNYTVPYFTLDSYDALDALKGNLGEYENEESAYKAFVYENYLWKKDAELSDQDRITKAYMQNIIENNFTKYQQGLEQGRIKYSNDVVLAVAKYIQNAAKYNLDYDIALEYEDNVIVAFLENYKEGVCRHYAAAATYLYRTLGIPARYVEGFVGFNAEEGQITELTDDEAHAWVEVYIDGIGWIQVEVTGGMGGEGNGDGEGEGGEGGGSGEGDGSGEGGGSGEGEEDNRPTLSIKPVYQCKVYDGEALVAEKNKIVLNPCLKELLAKGYSYDVTVSGEFIGDRYGCTGESSIYSFVLYDNNGNDITNTYKLEFLKGTLEILPVESEVIEVFLFEIRKAYDGTPLTSLLEGKANLEGLYYYDNSKYDVGLTMWLEYSGVDPMSLHITELNDSVNTYIKYSVMRNSDGQDITKNCRIRFITLPGIDENIYTPLEIVGQNKPQETQ